MKQTLRYCWHTLLLSWQANRYYAVASVLGRIYESTVYPFILVLILSYLLDLLAAGQVLSFVSVKWLLLGFVISSFLRMVIKSFLDTQQVLLEIKMDNYIDLQIDKKLTQLDPATFENPDFQNLLAQMEGVKGTIGVNLMRITALIDSGFKLIAAIIIVASKFPLFVPIILISTIPSFFVLDRYRRQVWKFFVEERSLLVRVSQYIKNLLSQDSTSKEVAIYQTGDVLYRKVQKAQGSYTRKFTQASQSSLPAIILAGSAQLAAFIYTQAVNLRSVMAGNLGVGQFTLFFQQTQNLMWGAEGILDNYSSINMRNKYVEKYFDFIHNPKFILPPDQPTPVPGHPHPPLIEFKQVSFKYPKTKKFILKDFDLTINPGEKIALVGENGAGKTTLIKLLLRFYDVSTGEILVNGVDIRQIDLESWYAQVGALFQDFIKYQFTFKENIIFGNRNQRHHFQLFQQALNQSGADTIVPTLPRKHQQVVGKMFNKGIDLSGGQWQKLALARAFFKNAPILILDEPTSAIDAKAEYEIFQRVQNLQRDKTVIIISHRFSTVRNADRILVLNDGRVIESGNHRQLVQLDGVYAELFRIQAQGYK